MKDKIVEIIRDEERVMVADILSDDMKKQILTLEMKRLYEPVPVINDSLQHAFDKEHAVVVIVDRKGIEIADEDLVATLTLQTDTGKIIGEEIYDPDELEMLKDDPEAYFISEHFVTYPNMAIGGEKQFFVVSELYDQLECEDKIDEITSSWIMGSPSTEADHFIKDCYDISHTEKIVTFIIGFDE